MNDQTTDGNVADRIRAADVELAALASRSGTAERDARLTVLGWVLMFGGLAVTVVAFAASGSMADTRDVLSAVIGGLAGVSISLIGVAVFLRYSFGQYLRAWMMRLVYEQQQRR